MAMKFRQQIVTRNVLTLENGQELNLQYEPTDVSDVRVVSIYADRIRVRYLVRDPGPVNPLEDWDGVGRIYSSHRSAGRSEHRKMQEALGLDEYWNRDPDGTPNPHVVRLDCYDHGGQVWSMSGTGIQDLFDTARGAGVWVPDDCILDDIRGAQDPAQKARQFCQEALEVLNAYLQGDVYGVVEEVFGPDGTRECEDATWGYFIHQEAVKALGE